MSSDAITLRDSRDNLLASFYPFRAGIFTVYRDEDETFEKGESMAAESVYELIPILGARHYDWDAVHIMSDVSGTHVCWSISFDRTAKSPDALDETVACYYVSSTVRTQCKSALARACSLR